MNRQSAGHVVVGRSRLWVAAALVTLTVGVLAVALAGCKSLGSSSTTSSTSGTPPTETTVSAVTTTVSAGAVTTGASGGSNGALIQQTLELAKQGKAPGLPFAADADGIEDVQSAWGAPSSQEAAGAGTYDVYSSHKAVFGFNKGEQLFDVRSSAADLQAITLSQITATLGAPAVERHTATQTIITYLAGGDFQLRWVLPLPTASVPDPHVDHISVYYPWGTVNMMAQILPNPSITITEAPGAAGHRFKFTIADAPAGYTQTEVEWIPDAGDAVALSHSQIVANGASGGTTPCFRINGAGTTYTFAYTAAMVGQSGKVRLVYQNADGAAIIGESDAITLN